MDQKFYKKCSWFPTSPKDKKEKTTVHRHGFCDIMKICRRWAQSLDYSPGRASVHERVQLLAEFLADGGCAPDVPISCRCRESSLKDSYSLAMALSPAFQVLSRHYEDECRLGGALKAPFQFLHGLFLPLDVMHHCRTMVTADSFLQDLLEVFSTVIPRPHGMCLSCRECQKVASEVSAGKRHKCSNRQTMGRKSEHRHTIDRFDYLCNQDQTCDKASWQKERSEQRQQPGLFSSIQQLKKDLENHQLYLHTIETRLSGLERRAQDVTKNLARANLELEAIKQGSVTLKTLVDERISSPVKEDLADLEESLWEQWHWSRRAGRSRHPESYRSDLGHRCAEEYQAGGSHVHQRSQLQTGLSTCKHHVDSLIQQVTQQINQMESDITFTSKLYHSAG